MSSHVSSSITEPIARKGRGTSKIRIGMSESGALSRRPGLRVWRILQGTVVVATIGLLLCLFLNPTFGLAVFWGIFVGGVPLVLVLAPGLWRNVCPMATISQSLRFLRRFPGLRLSRPQQNSVAFVSGSLFVLIVPLRKVLLDHNGPALATFLLLVLALAAVGGVVATGKGGWCSQFCPMFAVERFYGQSPLRVIRDAHCKPCVGCVANCYDLMPTRAMFTELKSNREPVATARMLFAYIMPWLCLAFFTQPDTGHIGSLAFVTLYGRTLLYISVGFLFYAAASRFSPFTKLQVQFGHVVVTINIYYWFVVPITLGYWGVSVETGRYVIQSVIALMSLIWLWRALSRERTLQKTSRPSIHKTISTTSPVASTPGSSSALSGHQDAAFPAVEC